MEANEPNMYTSSFFRFPNLSYVLMCLVHVFEWTSGQWNWNVRLVRSAQDSTSKKSHQLCNGRHQILWIHRFLSSFPITHIMSNSCHIYIYILSLPQKHIIYDQLFKSGGLFMSVLLYMITGMFFTGTNLGQRQVASFDQLLDQGGFRWASTSTWQPARWRGWVTCDPQLVMLNVWTL